MSDGGGLQVLGLNDGDRKIEKNWVWKALQDMPRVFNYGRLLEQFQICGHFDSLEDHSVCTVKGRQPRGREATGVSGRGSQEICVKTGFIPMSRHFSHPNIVSVEIPERIISVIR